jgi:Ankyrin repeats (3 copies)/Ankyrin repeats (many copies)
MNKAAKACVQEGALGSRLLADGAMMTRKNNHQPEPNDSSLMNLLRTIVSGERDRVARLLAKSPELARQALAIGASRQSETPYFFREIMHYLYAGDTALHVAAAAYQRDAARALIEKGARPGARNRRGAEPLHYAADGIPGSTYWNPDAQAATVEYLIEAGADPNSADNSGVAPLHRAVRTRCAAAVRALLAKGADPLRKNKTGSTPLHLAVQTTGRGGTGSAPSRQQQQEIIRLLLRHGAKPTDRDARGKTVAQSAISDWIRELLQTRP